MAKRAKRSVDEAGVAGEEAGPVEVAAEQAPRSDLAGLAEREAGAGARAAVQALGYPVAQEGRAQLERRERAAQAVAELERVLAHCGDARANGAIVRALRAVVGAL